MANSNPFLGHRLDESSQYLLQPRPLITHGPPDASRYDHCEGDPNDSEGTTFADYQSLASSQTHGYDQGHDHSDNYKHDSPKRRGLLIRKWQHLQRAKRQRLTTSTWYLHRLEPRASLAPACLGTPRLHSHHSQTVQPTGSTRMGQYWMVNSLAGGRNDIFKFQSVRMPHRASCLGHSTTFLSLGPLCKQNRRPHGLPEMASAGVPLSLVREYSLPNCWPRLPRFLVTNRCSI